MIARKNSTINGIVKFKFCINHRLSTVTLENILTTIVTKEMNVEKYVVEFSEHVAEQNLHATQSNTTILNITAMHDEIL